MFDLRRTKFIQPGDKGYDKEYVVTRQTNSYDLLKIYMGPQIQSYMVYSQFLTMFLCYFLFSSGIPIVYFIGFAFFGYFYWTYKYLITQFFAKSTQFSEDLAMWPPYFFAVGIVLHIFMGSWFYSV